MTPTTFGRYELRETLGWGGFATVYRALDPVLGREVALKTLLPHLARDPEVRARFLAEARALAALRHPNIVTVYEAGEAADIPFIAMELADGPTLSALVAAAGPLPLPRVLELLRGLCSAIDYLHAAGMVHRDLTAANVMLDAGDRVLLMDFGIARALEGTHFTRTGIPLGTPEAMAPEQVLGEVVGPPADVYALGILIYQLLAGRPPFSGDIAHVLYAQVHLDPPDIQTLRPDLPVTVQQALGSALAKQPGQRPNSAGALLAELRAVPPDPPLSTVSESEPLDRNPAAQPAAGGTDAVAIGARRLRHRWWPSIVAVAFSLCFVVAFVVGFFVIGIGRGSAHPSSASTVAPSTKVAAPAVATRTSCPGGTGLAAIRCQATAVATVSMTTTPIPRLATSPSARLTVNATPLAAAAGASATFASGSISGTDAWVQGLGPLLGCARLLHSGINVGLRLRLAQPDNAAPPIVDGPLMLRSSPIASDQCTELPPQPLPVPGVYRVLLYDQDWYELIRSDVTVPIPQSPGTRPAAVSGQGGIQYTWRSGDTVSGMWRACYDTAQFEDWLALETVVAVLNPQITTTVLDTYRGNRVNRLDPRPGDRVMMPAPTAGIHPGCPFVSAFRPGRPWSGSMEARV